MREWPETPRKGYGRAIFLDRDGTINVDTHYPHTIRDLKFLDRAVDALILLAQLPFKIIVVSNQAGIALGFFDHEDTRGFNAELRSRVETAGGRFDGFYYSPDLEPEDSVPGQALSKLSKPAPGMLIEAASDFSLDLSTSYLAGDKRSDVAAGHAVCCTTLLVKTGKGGSDLPASTIEPHVTVSDLFEAAEWIASHEEHLPFDSDVGGRPMPNKSLHSDAKPAPRPSRR